MHASSWFDRRAKIAAAALLVLSGCLLLPRGRLHAADATARYAQPRPQDSVWLVSCRGLASPIQKQVDKLAYWRYDAQKGWVRATLAELEAADDPRQVTSVFFHGNRIFFAEAFFKGWSAYRALVAQAGPRPVRFIIWSWPSEPVRGLIQDARIKAGRTDPCAYCLAWFLDQINPDVQVSLWAHSFGARIVTGALHLLGGGSMGGLRLDRQHPSRAPMNAVLLVAAIDSDWLLLGHRHGQALSQMAGVLLVNNGCDALLKRYHRLYCGGYAQAVGYTGLATGYLPAVERAKVSQLDVCCYVGKRHLFAGYLAAPDLVARMRRYLLFEDAASGEAPPQTAASERSTRTP